MRLSWPMPRRTSLMSACSPLAQVGHLVDEADLRGQQGVGHVLGHFGALGRHDQERLARCAGTERTGRAARRATSGRRTPTTTRSGFMKSSIAAPSLRNSGIAGHVAQSRSAGQFAQPRDDCGIRADRHRALESRRWRLAVRCWARRRRPPTGPTDRPSRRRPTACRRPGR